MRRRGWIWCCVGLASACSGGGETGLRVAATWRDLPIDQLGYTLLGPDGGALHAAERRPALAAGPLASGAEVVILLPDGLAGANVRCLVDGYAGGRPMRQGEGSVVVARGQTVAVAVALDGDPGRDGGADAVTPLDAVGDGRKDDGRRCTSAQDCASGHCVEGVCCDTACTDACHSCVVANRVGACTPLAAGTRDGRCPTEAAASCGLDGTCDAAGACRRYAAGTMCGGGTCTGNTLVGAERCDGKGACTAGAAQSCGAYVCDQMAQTCRTTCRSDGDCVPPATCAAGGRCGVVRALGATCGAGSDCGSGNCVDGVCCATAACATCFACNVGGAVGRCAPVPARTADPHGRCVAQPVSQCGADGTCNGAGACSVYPDGTSCRMGRTCLNGICR
jgi:hypothetical protein